MNSVEPPSRRDDGTGDAREGQEGSGDDRGEVFRAAQRDALGDEFAEQQRDEGDREDDDGDGQNLAIGGQGTRRVRSGRRAGRRG